MELENNAFGFGMDPFTNDYKVVSIRMYWDSTLDDLYNFNPPACYLKHISIYSLRDDSWRDFKGFFPECFVFSSFEFYTYMDGVYYWCAYDKNGHSMKLSFHMGYEVFQKILEQDQHTRPLPFQGIPELGWPHPGTNLVEHYSGVYKGCLAWKQCYPTDFNTPNVFNIWVWKEECWTRELIAGPFVGAIPLGFWKNGEILIQVVDGNLVLADPITLELKELGTVKSFQAFIYHESLVSVHRRNEELDHSYTTLPLKLDVLRDMRRDKQTDYDFTDSSSDDTWDVFGFLN
ncbi:F-box/kelch-repeat protein [Camellia lanceoleosa]|uniref:F-box/kelch-repeat protein n=1 Tax=Camellia lanceoleosa TaxID=1840588 RepID=A0ACC0GLJ5_9ERIC|nr:F-box/kelch-repeat protein [Camellia lanceoleosa]